MTLKRSNTRYVLRIFNRDLNYIKERIWGLPDDKISSDCVIVMEIENEQKQSRFEEIDIVKNKKDYELIYRQLAYDGCRYNAKDIQRIKLTEQQVNALLGKNDVKQL